MTDFDADKWLADALPAMPPIELDGIPAATTGEPVDDTWLPAALAASPTPGVAEILAEISANPLSDQPEPPDEDCPISAAAPMPDAMPIGLVGTFDIV